MEFYLLPTLPFSEDAQQNTPLKDKSSGGMFHVIYEIFDQLQCKILETYRPKNMQRKSNAS